MQGDSIRCCSTLLVAAALSVAAIACGERIKVGEELAGTGNGPGSGGGGQGGKDGGQGGEGGHGGGGVPDTSDTVAMLYSQLDDPTTTGGSSLDPNTLFLFIATRPISCQDPYGDYRCDSWLVSLGIPPALQVPGVLALSDPALIASFSLQGPDEGGGSCFGGGGSYTEGTLTLVSLSAEQVIFRLDGTSAVGPVADGEYVAARCP